jgi:hypothetical protein
MNRYHPIIISMLLIAAAAQLSCSSDFMSGGSGSGGTKKFSGGDDNPGTDNANPSNPNNGKFGTGTTTTIDGTNAGGNGVNQSGGVDTRLYKPVIVTVHRRECSTSNNEGSNCDGGSDDQSDVAIEYQVIGANKTEKGTIPGEARSFEIPRACPDNGTVNIELTFVVGSSGRYKPNKQLVGGPIGFRRDDKTIWVGFEKDEVGGRGNYHNNDDMVLEFKCENSKRLNIPAMCFDQNIPNRPGTRAGKSFSGPGSDLITDVGTYRDSEFQRVCNGS